ncbi:MAG: hypothetical protein MPJ50_00965 [Pirellulales bacterium]|nr:hypothetical protein [Pirellulales bacterium]
MATITRCEICRGMLDEEDLFCANCGTEAPDRTEAHALQTQTTTHKFQCNGCGASMSYSAEDQALACPFCGSVHLEEQPDAKTLVANSVVPMTVTQHDAINAMRSWLGKGMWRPGDLSEKAMLVTTRSVYVPYWVFEAETHTYWTADTNRTPAFARGDWCPMAGEHTGRHSGLLVGASGALTPAETAEICPFDLSAGKPPEEVDLQFATVEEFGLQRKYARPLARAGIEARERNHCDALYVPGRSRNVNVNVRIEGMTSEPVLLPIWIMAYRYKNRVFRLLVNGQTGKVTGSAPTSVWKVLAAVGAGIAVVLLVLSLAALFLSR